MIGAAVCLALSVPAYGQALSWSHGPNLPSTCSPVDIFIKTSTTMGIYLCPSADTWVKLDQGGEGSGGEGIPAGSILFIKSGSCPTGFTEESDLNGKTLVGTLAANSNVGTTGGSDTITPSAHAGSAVSAHAGTAVADHASHTHTYTDVIAHTHTLPVGATDDTAAPFDRADAGTNASGANATTATGSTGVATGTTAGPSAVLTHSVTQPSNHAVTQPSDHAAMDNRSAFVRVIACRKT